jgi:GntR family transcriptional regulator
LYLHLNHHSGEPIYRQIVEAIKYRVATGELSPGDQLPSIRALSSDLKINPRTVVRAYEELQHAGLVVMRQGQGVFVRTDRAKTSAGNRRAALKEQVRRLLAEADRLGASPEEVMKIIEQVSREMEGAK